MFTPFFKHYFVGRNSLFGIVNHHVCPQVFVLVDKVIVDLVNLIDVMILHALEKNGEAYVIVLLDDGPVWSCCWGPNVHGINRFYPSESFDLFDKCGFILISCAVDLGKKNCVN